MRRHWVPLFITTLLPAGVARTQQPYVPPDQPGIPAKWRNSIPPRPWSMPLYKGPIPNSKGAPNEESEGSLFGRFPAVEKISRPTMTAYLAPRDRSVGSSVIIFPGGGYVGEVFSIDCDSVAELLQNRGVAAFVVKYRLPSDVTMDEKSIGPLQDAQEAIKLVREHASAWGLNPARLGVMGLSAGGHLASTAGTHFLKAYIPNAAGANLRPDFMILVYPVISMLDEITDKGTRTALLGPNPPESLIKLFSNELQVTEATPPAMLVHAEGDTVVDAENSIRFFEALRRHHIPAELLILPKSDHGFFSMPRDEWLQPIFNWMIRNGWMKP